VYVYVYSSLDDLWTTGFYDPSGTWHPERDCQTEDEAASRVHWLNGGCDNSNCRPPAPRQIACLTNETGQ